MADKKPIKGRQKPVHLVRCGEVTAAIYLRQSNAGFSYYDFCLGRCWNSMASGKEAHGSSFFESNEKDLVRAIHDAAEWIRAKTCMTPVNSLAETGPDNG